MTTQALFLAAIFLVVPYALADAQPSHRETEVVPNSGALTVSSSGTSESKRLKERSSIASENESREEDELWTLEDIEAYDEQQQLLESTPFDKTYLKYASKKLPILGKEPPQEPTEYAIALANVMTKPTSELFAYANYRGQTPRENVGHNIRIGGNEARIATLDVRENGTEVGKYYARELASRGIQPMMNQLADNAVYLSFHGEDGFLRTITLVAQSATHTVVLASVSDARKVYEGLLGIDDDPLKRLPKVWDDWKEPPSEGIPLVLEQSEGTTRQVTRRITVRAKTAQDVMDQYVRDLSLNGWSVSTDLVSQQQEEGLVKIFEKPAEGKQCMLTIVDGASSGMFECLTICNER